MNPTQIQNAEDALTRSIARFESAMERLAVKVEDTSHRIQHIADIAKHQKDEFMHMKDTALAAVDPVLPYISKAGDMGRRAYKQVKSNPSLYLWTAVGVIGGLWAISYFEKAPSDAASQKNFDFEKESNRSYQ